MTLPSFVGRYEVRREIARGGFAVVVQAWDEELECLVALKILHDSLVGNAEIEQRFLHEARLLRRVNSPHVITIHDIGRLNDGRPYFILDYADRGTLADRLTSPGLSPPYSRQALTTLIDSLAEGLKAIHQAGLVHRDIKPDNILFQWIRHAGPSDRATQSTPRGLVETNERVLVGDLGIAKDVLYSGSSPTLLGGTPRYLAPEQNDATAEVSPAVDIYAASAVLYHVLTGKPPPELSEPDALIIDLPDAWQGFLQQGLAVDPQMRHANIEAWREAAHDALDKNPTNAAPHAAPVDHTCPYKGLAAYQAEDAPFFCGRETLVEELLRRLQLHQVLVVGGPSGSGKSSLVRAGLLPALHSGMLPGSETWRITLMTPGREPLNELCNRLIASAPDPVVTPDAADLAEDPARIRALMDACGMTQQNSVIFIDQFEELFTLAQTAPREVFFAALSAVTELAESRVKLVIAVRADFYNACAQVPWLAGKITNNQVLVGPMTKSELRRAITEPARRAGLHLEQGLVTAVMEEAGSGAGSLPLMAHALVETWVRRRGSTLTLDGFRAAGGVAGAISQTADAVYEHQLDPAALAVARHLFLRLITSGEGMPETRRALPKSEIAMDARSTTMLQLVEQLTKARLLTVDDGRIQIAHEALLHSWPRLRRWIEESRDDLRMRQKISHAANEWQAEGRETDLLYRGTPLLSALEWRADNPDQLGPLEHAFLTAAQDHQAELDARIEDRRRRTRRWRSAAVGALVILAAGTSLSSLVAYQAAQKSRENAERAAAASSRAEQRFAAALGAAAFGHVDEDPRLALALSTEAIARSPGNAPSYDTRAAIISARRQLADGRVFLLGSPIPAGEALAIALSPDGTLLAIAQADGAIDLFDLPSRQFRDQPLMGHSGGVRAIEFDHSGQRLVSVGVDATIRLWTLSTTQGIQQQVIGMADDIIPDVCIHPTRNVIATASADGTVRLWDGTGRGEIRDPVGRLPLEFNTVEFSPDGRALLAASNDAVIHAWSLPSGEPVFPPIAYAHSSHLLSLEMNPQGDLLVGVDSDGTVSLIRYPQGDKLDYPFNSGSKIGAAVFNADGGLLIGGDSEGRLRVWDMLDHRELGATPSGHSQAIIGASISEDGKLLATLGRDQTIRLWSLGTDYPLAAAYPSPDAKTKAVAFSPDGRQLASADSSGRVLLWDMHEETVARELTRHESAVWALAFLPGQDLLASADRQGVIHLVDLQQGDKRQVLRADGPVWTLAALDAGQLLAAATDKGVTIWRLSDGTEQRTIPSPGGQITRMAVSPQGRQIAVSSTDGAVRIFDVASGTLVRTLNAEQDTIWSVAFSRDGKRLATASGNEVVALWDLRSEKREYSLSGHSGGATDIAFLADAHTLVVTDRSGGLHWWDLRTQRKLVSPLQAHAGSSWRLAVHPDGATIATAGDDGLAKVWDVLSIDRACKLGRPTLDTRHLKQYLGPDQEAVDCSTLSASTQPQ